MVAYRQGQRSSKQRTNEYRGLLRQLLVAIRRDAQTRKMDASLVGTENIQFMLRTWTEKIIRLQNTNLQGGLNHDNKTIGRKSKLEVVRIRNLRSYNILQRQAIPLQEPQHARERLLSIRRSSLLL